MSLTPDELIDIKNSILFKPGLEEVFRLMPEYKNGGVGLDSYATIIIMNEDLPYILGHGGTKRSRSGLYKQIKKYNGKKGNYITHLQASELPSDSYSFLTLTIYRYCKFIEDDEGESPSKDGMSHKQRKELDNNPDKLKKYVKRYVKVVEGMGPPLKKKVPGGVKKYGKIIQSKS